MVRVPGPILVSPKPLLLSVTVPSPRFRPAVVTLKVGDPARVVALKFSALLAVPFIVTALPPADSVPMATDVYPDASRAASPLSVTLFPAVRAAGAAADTPFRANTPRVLFPPAAMVF